MVGVAGSLRAVYADNLKVVLVSGVIVAHVTMAWTPLPGWVFREPAVREPLLEILGLVALLGVLVGMPLFFLVAGMFTPASLQRKGLRRYALDRTIRLLVPSLLFVVVLTPPSSTSTRTRGTGKGTSGRSSRAPGACGRSRLHRGRPGSSACCWCSPSSTV